tara:strand:- start:690 stop:1019 length:330 start_codon:yes stop_codon:yes gene_type:complete
MFVGPYLALTDPTFFGTPESTTTILGDWIYTARNLAVGVAFIIAYYLKNAPMLFILIFVRLFTDLIDGPAFWFFRDPISEFFFIFLFLFGYYIPGIIALIYLWKQIQKN